MNGYVKACDLAKKWGLTDRQIQIFCKAGKIPGAVKFGPAWAIPEGANASWGDAFIDATANYIKENCPEIKGFNRRGLYRMKQFYEMYVGNEFVRHQNDGRKRILHRPVCQRKIQQA